MKIFDCTTFYNEKMMMDVRFNILSEYVSKFIVVESLYSHSGKKKKLNFDINDYPKFKEKIRYIVIEEEPEGILQDEDKNKHLAYKRLNSIRRIEQSYNYMSKGIEDANDEDLIMLSDNDEIPNLQNLDFGKINNNYIIFEQLFFYFKFNLLYDRMFWFGTKACRKKKLKSFSTLRNIKNKEYPFWRLDTFFTNYKKINLKIIKNGGWHFTNLKNPVELFEKLSNFGHHDEFEASELSVEKIKEKIKNKEMFYDHFAEKESKNKWDFNYKLKKIDHEFLPEFLKINSEKYKEWFD
tara:strand:+ start:563 stop:1447 length:885 start_codon:yes stop_codon:yes gene_type:complete